MENVQAINQKIVLLESVKIKLNWTSHHAPSNGVQEHPTNQATKTLVQLMLKCQTRLTLIRVATAFWI
jgi:hypothetical protein